MKNMLKKIKDYLNSLQGKTLNDRNCELYSEIDMFMGNVVDNDNTMGNIDHVFNRIRELISDAETVEEFIRWTFESVSSEAYNTALNWLKGMEREEILFYSPWTCSLVTQYEAGTIDLSEFGINFKGNLESCLCFICTLLEQIAKESKVILIPDMTQDEIDDIRTVLSQTKEECFDGAEGYWEEEPEFDANDIYAQDQHRRWSEESWTKYDELSIEVLGIQEGKLQQLILYLKENKADAKVGDIYDILSEIENKESA